MNPWINRFAIFAIIFGVWAMAYDTGRHVCTQHQLQTHR
jgi:hypothetical protein